MPEEQTYAGLVRIHAPNVGTATHHGISFHNGVAEVNWEHLPKSVRFVIQKFTRWQIEEVRATLSPPRPGNQSIETLPRVDDRDARIAELEAYVAKLEQSLVDDAIQSESEDETAEPPPVAESPTQETEAPTQTADNATQEAESPPPAEGDDKPKTGAKGKGKGKSKSGSTTPTDPNPESDSDTGDTTPPETNQEGTQS